MERWIRHASSLIPEQFRAALLCVDVIFLLAEKFVDLLVIIPGCDVISVTKLSKLAESKFLTTTQSLRIAL